MYTLFLLTLTSFFFFIILIINVNTICWTNNVLFYFVQYFFVLITQFNFPASFSKEYLKITPKFNSQLEEFSESFDGLCCRRDWLNFYLLSEIILTQSLSSACKLVLCLMYNKKSWTQYFRDIEIKSAAQKWVNDREIIIFYFQPNVNERFIAGFCNKNNKK